MSEAEEELTVRALACSQLELHLNQGLTQLVTFKRA